MSASSLLDKCILSRGGNGIEWGSAAYMNDGNIRVNDFYSGTRENIEGEIRRIHHELGFEQEGVDAGTIVDIMHSHPSGRFNYHYDDVSRRQWRVTVFR